VCGRKTAAVVWNPLQNDFCKAPFWRSMMGSRHYVETEPRKRGIGLMIRNKPLRRSLGALLVLLGALLIWLPYDLASGIVLVLIGAALELVGIALEKRDKQV
jgi:hypothetical protein